MQQERYVFVVIERRQEDDMIRHITELGEQALSTAKDLAGRSNWAFRVEKWPLGITQKEGKIIADVGWIQEYALDDG